MASKKSRRKARHRARQGGRKRFPFHGHVWELFDTCEVVHDERLRMWTATRRHPDGLLVLVYVDGTLSVENHTRFQSPRTIWRTWIDETGELQWVGFNKTLKHGKPDPLTPQLSELLRRLRQPDDGLDESG